MDILEKSLQDYLDAHCDLEPELLQRINRETHLKILKPNMLSGHYQGRLLSFLSKMMKPKLILEIGTYTGYATLCLAEGLAEDGILHTIEANEELGEMLKTNFEGSAFREKIRVYFGQAMQIIPNLPLDNVDLVFIDADKKNNFAYFCIILDKVRAGGLIIIDNVLWKGRVYGPENDTDTKIIRELNDRIAADERIEKLILPVRDGLMVIKKK